MATIDSLERDIVSDLQSAFDQAPLAGHTRFGRKSKIWSRPAVQFRKGLFQGCLVDGIRELQLDGELAYTFPTNSVQGGHILEQQLEYLHTLHLDLQTCRRTYVSQQSQTLNISSTSTIARFPPNFYAD